jgi:hypothetical protein
VIIASGSVRRVRRVTRLGARTQGGRGVQAEATRFLDA